ncbi:MAG TPA: endolytic transglycosylase MltG [Lacibacter sp.]|nr:endolytic transglycosylase MltG [Lacibacter sp.]
MKKVLKITAALLLVVAIYLAWLFFAPASSYEGNNPYLYIRTAHATKQAVLQTLKDSSLIKHIGAFEWLGDRLNIWQKLRPGKYVISGNESVFSLVRKIRNNRQEQVNLTITKIRTKNDFAQLVGRKFETDADHFLAYLTNNDSLQHFGLDSNTIMTMVLPDTYTYYWSTSPKRILQKLEQQHQKFWTAERKNKAAVLGLTPQQVYILASIVEEETLRNDEKPIISSVYLNRLRKNMYLGADPTVKFAVGDFSLKRIYFGHISATAANPYNTYKNKGLPPGPICTPQAVTIDAVLNTQPTNYLFFCAKPNGNGYHAFAENETEHFKNAKAYQDWLNQNKIQ